MVTMNGEETGAIIMPGTTPTLDHSINTTLDDDVDDGMSDESEGFEDGTDLMTATMEDEVTAQLAAAGPVGMAAAAAIASAKKRKRPHQFETNPSIRKRQQTRLLRKLRQTIDEFTIRVGMQAVVLVAIPGKPQNSFKCFGAKPLEDVIRNLRPVVMQDLEGALAQHTPVPQPEDPSLHELPPLVIDGIPTPVEKMTQAQLRAFIPLMLKYSTGRGKPGWGKESTRPHWWPQDLPWANVRMDARTEDEKQKVSWTHALRQIVINCYKFHGREDLLPVFSGDHDDVDIKPPIAKMPKASPDSHITNNTSNNSAANLNLNTHSQSQNQSISTQALTSEKMYQICEFLKPGNQDKFANFKRDLNFLLNEAMGQFGPTVLQTITNPDGTVSIIQVDATNSIITLPDGTTAQVQGVATLQHSADGQTLQELHDGSDGMSMVDLNSVTHASLGQEGQIILTGEDGHPYPVTVSGMIGVHGVHNMFQTVVANISQISGQNSDGTLQRLNVSGRRKAQKIIRLSKDNNVIEEPTSTIVSYFDHGGGVVTPMVMPKLEPGTEGETAEIPVSALTGDPTQTQLVTVNSRGQVIHNDKVYQLCEFLKPDSQEKMIMMAQVSADGEMISTEECDPNSEIQVVEEQSIHMTEEIASEEMAEEVEQEEEEAQEQEQDVSQDSTTEMQISETTVTPIES